MDLFESSGSPIPSNVYGGWKNYEAGETVSQLDLIYIGDDGKAYKAKSNDADKRPATAIVWQGGSAGDTVYAIQKGIVPGHSGLTAGATCYLSTTAGEITQMQPGYAQVVGTAVTESSVSYDMTGASDTGVLDNDGPEKGMYYEKYSGGL